MTKKIFSLTIVVAFAVITTSIYAQEMVKDINPADNKSGFRVTTFSDEPLLFNFNNTLFFWSNGAGTAESPGGLYKSDGTTAGTSYFGNAPGDETVCFGDRIYILVANALYSTRGGLKSEPSNETEGDKSGGKGLKGKITISGLPSGSGPSGGSSQYPGFDLVKSKDEIMESWDNNSLVEMNGKLYFFGSDKANQTGSKLWVSDGSKSGTNVALTLSCNPHSYLHYMVVNNVLFFAATDIAHGTELWRTDGTAEGTFMVKDINTKYMSNGNTMGSSPSEFVAVNGGLYFIAKNNDGVEQLWKSDGTADGTILVPNTGFELGATTASVFHRGFAAIDNTLYFVAKTVTNGAGGRKVLGSAIWKTDGTEKGTQSVYTFTNGGLSPMWLTNLNGTLIFIADDGKHGRELWKSDGTAAGTKMITDINQQKSSTTSPTRDAFSSTWDMTGGGHARPGFTVADGLLFFVADDGLHGLELWKTDGTAEGTLMVKDIKPFDAFGSNPKDLIVINHVLYFTADDGPHGRELWKYSLVK